ncbi:ABC transporter permease [Cellulomonas marina]|uniref:Putative ABC transport system permease protein n=1 Tax=Cellulomonas marina TaxID=988821 RepID=A0A1I0WZX4_9CELL|nr:FtsX-like permease family protein [Cellulomonas marina]GIG29332.1 ABC transporter ATP-binding protein [Cellulomonas marina]SFA94124.1 putative ABC transport system permease protein [Cellulomonas marina]
MLRLTFAQMRRSLPRLVAAGLAVALGTAFVAATLLAGDVLTRTTYDSVTASFGRADLVVTRAELEPAAVDAAGDVPGVDAVAPLDQAVLSVAAGGRTAYPLVLPAPGDERLASVRATAGVLPQAPGQIALPATTATQLDVGVGDRVQVAFSTPGPDDTWVESTADVAVTGITADVAGAWQRYGGAGLADPADLATWVGVGTVPTLLVAVDPGADVTAVQAALRSEVAPATGATPQVLTRDEAARAAVAELSGDADVLVAVALAFAAVALVVAALVIANTFAVLVAQRTRTLALLRCVGARRSQLAASVVTEAAVLGLAASVAGLLGGTALVQVVLLVLARTSPDVPLPTTVAPGLAAVVAPLVVGTVVTVLAALVPAREATRVSPVAALRPLDAPVLGAAAGRVRAAVSLVSVVLGGLTLAAAVATGLVLGGGALPALALGILGGTVSFVGVLVGAVLWVPRLVAGVGALLARTGPSARLAAANTLRNPRRTTATSAALLIGVTLVAMMSTGAATARTTLAAELDEQYAVDLAVTSLAGPGEAALPASAADDVDRVDGVARVAALAGAPVLELGGQELGGGTTVLGLDPADAGVLRAPDLVAPLEDGTVLVPERLTESYLVVRDGDTVTLTAGSTAAGSTAEDGSVVDPAVGGQTLTLRAVVGDVPSDGLLVTAATLARLAPEAGTTSVWAALSDDATPSAVLAAVQEALPTDVPLQAVSGAAERESYDQVIDTMLLVVVGLLAVAVVIALVGVANTLSLSVIERRRESATLRAIGLTRGQLRRTLAVEGVLVAGVGTLAGTVLGLLYGWAGAAAVLGPAGQVRLGWPLRDLAIVLVVALVAGLAASVLPARSATRTPPVAALAVD